MFRFELILILTLISTSFLNAFDYDKDVLNIYSKMIPRFVIMSTQEDKIKTEIEVCVLYNELDEIAANLLMNKIKTNYPKGLKNHPIKLIQSNYDNFEICKNTQIAFMFNTDKTDIQRVNDFLQKRGILSVSYDMALLDYDVDISLFIGRRVMPYINIKNITDKKIALDNLLVRVSKIYKKSDK